MKNKSCFQQFSHNDGNRWHKETRRKLVIKLVRIQLIGEVALYNKQACRLNDANVVPNVQG